MTIRIGSYFWLAALQPDLMMDGPLFANRNLGRSALVRYNPESEDEPVPVQQAETRGRTTSDLSNKKRVTSESVEPLRRSQRIKRN